MELHRLHSAASNCNFWKIVGTSEGFRLDPDTRKMRCGGVAIAGVVLFFGGIMAHFVGDFPIFWFIAIATSAACAAFAFIKAARLDAAGVVFEYRASDDSLLIPKIRAERIMGAKSRVRISEERYRDVEHTVTELNLIVDDVRHAFLADIGDNLTALANGLRREGFRIETYADARALEK